MTTLLKRNLIRILLIIIVFIGLLENTSISPVQAGFLTISPLNDTTITKETLVSTLLSGEGGGITVSNIKWHGNNEMGAVFANGDTLGFPNGIILSSGRTSLISQTSSNFASGSYDQYIDTDLNDEFGSVYDCSALEFDFIPEGDMVSFRYRVGSEEYPEYINMADAFAFYVNGENKALLEDGITKVSIGTINQKVNTEYYVHNSADTSGCPSPDTTGICTNNGIEAVYDGFTTILSFTAPVNQGVTNHIKIVIGDNGDNSYDSSVFIQGGSFSAKPNAAPTDITLDNNLISPDLPSGTQVGSLSTTDPDVTDKHTYALVSGIGDTDNVSFKIENNILKTNASLSVGNYSIRIRTTDNGTGFKSFEKEFAIIVVNRDPTNIDLSSSRITEKMPIGTIIGTFTTADLDKYDTHSYSFISGSGDTDNTRFIIDGDLLKTNFEFDYSVQSSYTIRVQTDDGNGGLFEKQFTITIAPVGGATADDDTVSVRAGSSVKVEFLTNDHPSPGEGWDLTTREFVTLPDNGTAVFGSIIYTPNDDFVGFDQLSYRICDTGGYCDTASVSINVLNNSPTNINLTSARVTEKQNVGTIIGTLTTDDLDDDETYTYSLVSGTGDADNALFQIDGDLLKTNAVFDYAIKNSFTIRIRTDDGHTGIYEKQFTITVTREGPVNANHDSAMVPIGGSVTVDILENDEPSPGEVWDKSTQEFVTLPRHGTAEFGSIIYTPDEGYAGMDEVTYRICDTGEYCATATAYFTIMAATLPETGFSPEKFTPLPIQLEAQAYSYTDSLWIEIPILGIKAAIVGVPFADSQWKVEWLGERAGYLEGTAFPTTPGNTVITGHSFNNLGYPSIFYSIQNMRYDDEIIIHAWGNEYVYRVRSIKQVDPEDTSIFAIETLDWITLISCLDYVEESDDYAMRSVVKAILVDVRSE
jgi:LPXTG-site transpeptidase (sortase) family protein